jgi:3-deoxy-D-arabino-heptulosonate 7-phosphate (DAHP) synthase class II
VSPPQSVIGPEHCACLDSVLKSIAQTRALLAQCTDCGLPVEDYVAQNEAQQQLVTRLKATFYPHNP